MYIFFYTKMKNEKTKKALTATKIYCIIVNCNPLNQGNKMLQTVTTFFED